MTGHELTRLWRNFFLDSETPLAVKHSHGVRLVYFYGRFRHDDMEIDQFCVTIEEDLGIRLKVDWKQHGF